MISVISPLFLDMGLFRNQVVINPGGERGEMSSRAISFLKSFSLLELKACGPSSPLFPLHDPIRPVK